MENASGSLERLVLVRFFRLGLGQPSLEVVQVRPRRTMLWATHGAPAAAGIDRPIVALAPAPYLGEHYFFTSGRISKTSPPVLKKILTFWYCFVPLMICGHVASN